MGTLAEDRLCYATDPAKIGIGEDVLVITLLGNIAVEGVVKSSHDDGLIVSSIVDDKEVSKFYPASLYKFVPVTDEIPRAILPIDKKLYDSSSKVVVIEPDEAVKRKLEGAGDGDKAGNGSTVVNTDNLPDVIKKHIVGVDELQPDAVNKILSDISNAAMRALRQARVKEVEVYDLVGKIVNAVDGVIRHGKK